MINSESDRQLARRNLKGKEPKRFFESLFVKDEEAKNIPESFVCDKHGPFDVIVEKRMFSGRFGVQSVCPECLKEFEQMLDKEEAKVKVEREKKAEEARRIKTEKVLISRGVSKRYIDKTFDNYLTDTPEKKNALLKCKELCSSIIKNEKTSNLIMVGGVGTGKTHLANSLVKDLYYNDKKCVRINLIDLIRDLKSTWNKDSEDTERDVIDYYVEIDLLIIDEVGVQFGSETEKLFVFDIINGRYDNCLPTVIISNLDINGVKEIIGDRCVDRLREDGGKVVAFDWSSHR